MAKALCVLFAILGLLPPVMAAVVKSGRARAWAAEQTERLLREQNIVASYGVAVSFWPAAVQVTNLRVESTDGKGPAVVAASVSLRPRLFALLSGKLAIAEVEVSSPVVRLVVQDGQPANVGYRYKASSTPRAGPFHAPFELVSVNGARVDVEVDGLRVRSTELDVDVTSSDDPDAGTAFEVAVRAGETLVRRVVPDASRIDDDSFCSVDARVRIEPTGLLVRRLDAAGFLDLDAAPNTAPSCALPDTDVRRVELSASHLRVQKAADGQGAPQIAGYLRARFPVKLAERLVSLPETDGWVGVQGEVRYGPGMSLPDVDAHLEVHHIRLGRYRFAKEIQSEVSIADRVVRSPKTVVHIADGVATLQNVEVRPLDPGIPMKAQLAVTGVSFERLMANLGVSQQAHVAWDVKELSAPDVVGTLSPVHIDGDFTAPTANFAVYDRPAKDPSRLRIVGVREADLKAHFAVRPNALEFQNVHVQFPHGSVSGGFVSIGFRDTLRVDVPTAHIDLADISPLATIPLSGQADVTVHVGDTTRDARVTADGRISSFVFSDMPFGNITQVHVGVQGPVVSIRDLKASRNKSSYEVPSARLDFSGPASLTMDGLVATSNLMMRDFLGVFRMDDDPRLAGVDGRLAASADVHVALGGPEDPCGGGSVLVRTKVHGERLALFGETFDDGDVDLTYRWEDRLAGIAGAAVDLHGVTLRKVKGEGLTAMRGSIVGSGALRRGGAVRGQFVLDSLPVSRIDMLGKYGAKAEGTVSGVVTATGTIDAWAAHGVVDVSPVRFRGASLGPSHLVVDVNQTPGPPRPARGTTRCHAPIPASFDRDSYFADTSSQGEISVDGDLFGGQVSVSRVTMSRQKDAQLAGDVSFRKVDVGALAHVLASSSSADSSLAALTGEISGDLHVQHADMSDMSTARLTFKPGTIAVAKGTSRLTLKTPGASIVVADNTLTVPNVVVGLETPTGLGGSATVSGTVRDLFRDPVFALRGDLAPLDLSTLAGVVPKIDRAAGVVTGVLTVGGRASAPDIAGALHVKGGEIAVRGLPSALTELDLDLTASASEVRITHGAARFAGGEVRASGSIPITKDGLGRAKLDLTASDVHLAPADGVSTTFDAVLEVTTDLGAGAPDAIPHATGQVTITSFEYARPVNFDLNTLGGRSKKTSGSTYDPSQDALRLEIAVRSKVPLLIRNNLVEASLRIDSGSLMVTGTNQLVGLRGNLKVLPGGRFHILANDFDVKQGEIRFEDPTRIVPNVDVLAVTEYRRYTDTTTAAAAGAGAGPEGIASQGAGNLWRISLHAHGDVDDLRLEMTSEPALSQEDVVLLLTIGMTGAEVAQVQAGSLGTSAALEAIATASGADRAVKNAIPVIDDFRFGSAYSSKTGRTEPQVIVGKHLADAVRATVATSVGENQELRAAVEWRLSQRIGVLGSYDNINDVSSSTVGNIGVDLRWHIEFE